jgi:hypothetical protein
MLVPINGQCDFYAMDTNENKRFVHEIENYVWDTKRGGLLNGLKDQPKKIDDDILDAIMQVILTLPKEASAGAEPIRTRSHNSWKI